jgi:hypothetical protein
MLDLVRKMAKDPHRKTVEALAQLLDKSWACCEGMHVSARADEYLDKAAEVALDEILASNRLDRAVIFGAVLRHGNILNLSAPGGYLHRLCDPSCGSVLLEFLRDYSTSKATHGFPKLHVIYCIAQVAQMKTQGSPEVIRAYLNDDFMSRANDFGNTKREIGVAAWAALAALGERDALSKVADMQREENESFARSTVNVSCAGCQKTYYIGRDAAVVTSEGVGEDFRASWSGGNEQDPDLVEHLPPCRSPSADSKKEVERLHKARSAGEVRFWRCNSCATVNKYPWG